MSCQRFRGAALIAMFVVLVVACLPAVAAAQFLRVSKNPRNILEGNWQSCQEATGQYTERVYDHVVNGVPQFEVHLGPKREFAIFRGVQDEHREHASEANLLKPYRVPLQGMRARQRWEIPELKMAFTVTLGGGARTDCESWYIVLDRKSVV